jgi:translation initiation factor 2 beta subunit (eIF-2beta)/eIF-5
MEGCKEIRDGLCRICHKCGSDLVSAWIDRFHDEFHVCRRCGHVRNFTQTQIKSETKPCEPQ